MKRFTIFILAVFIQHTGIFSQDMFFARKMTGSDSPFTESRARCKRCVPLPSPTGRMTAFISEKKERIIIYEGIGKNMPRARRSRYVINSASNPAWSPDGSLIAFTDMQTGAICIYDPVSHKKADLHRISGFILIPSCWCPDGSGIMVACQNLENKSYSMFKLTSDGRFRIHIICHKENFLKNISLSPDGSMMVYTAINHGIEGIYVMPSGGGRSIPLAVSELFANHSPAWSPDGKMISFTSNRSGKPVKWTMTVDQAKLRTMLGIIADTTQFYPI